MPAAWRFRTLVLGCAIVVGCAATSQTSHTDATSELEHCRGAHQTEIPDWHLQRVDRLPQVVQQESPNYPEDAVDAGVSGTVVLHALVCADGSVHDTRIVRSVPMLDAAAVEAVRKWTFQPAMDSSGTIAAWTEARVEFRLPPRKAVSDDR